MSHTKTFRFLVAALMLLGAATIASAQAEPSAAGLAKLTYPIADLGGCTSQKACRKFCEESKNMPACVAFGEKKGLLTQEQAKVSRKAAARFAAGTTPGKCSSKESCEKYCSDNTASIKECIAFAEDLGALPPEQLAQAKKVQKALEAGAKMPGGCTDKKSCEAYCSDNTHFSECIDFAEKAGFVKKEEAEMARKVGGKGPNGCTSKDACEAYCGDPAHAQACFDFAAEKGLISKDQIEQVKKAGAQIKTGLDQIPPEMKTVVEQCLKDTLGSGEYERVLAGGVPSKNMGEAMRKCFEQNMKAFAEKMRERALEAGKGQLKKNMPQRNPQGEDERGEDNRGDDAPAGAVINIPKIPDIEGVNMENLRRGAPSAEDIKKIREEVMKNIPQGIPQGLPQGAPQGVPLPQQQ